MNCSCLKAVPPAENERFSVASDNRSRGNTVNSKQSENDNNININGNGGGNVNVNVNVNEPLGGKMVDLDNEYFDQVDEEINQVAKEATPGAGLGDNGDNGGMLDVNKGFGQNLQEAFSVEDAMMDDIVQHMETKR